MILDHLREDGCYSKGMDEELDEILALEIFKPLIRLEVNCAYTNFKGIDIEWHHIANFRSELQDLMPRAFKKIVS